MAHHSEQSFHFPQGAALPKKRHLVEVVAGREAVVDQEGVRVNLAGVSSKQRAIIMLRIQELGGAVKRD